MEGNQVERSEVFRPQSLLTSSAFGGSQETLNVPMKKMTGAAVQVIETHKVNIVASREVFFLLVARCNTTE